MWIFNDLIGLHQIEVEWFRGRKNFAAISFVGIV